MKTIHFVYPSGSGCCGSSDDWKDGEWTQDDGYVTCKACRKILKGSRVGFKTDGQARLFLAALVDLAPRLRFDVDLVTRRSVAYSGRYTKQFARVAAAWKESNR